MILIQLTFLFQVLQKAAKEMLNYNGLGYGVMGKKTNFIYKIHVIMFCKRF